MIPYRSGIVRITPLDSKFSPIHEQAYTTSRDFLTSTQRGTTYSYETFHNASGEASDYIATRRETLALTTQIYDPRFDAIVSGKELSTTELTTLRDVQFFLPKGSTKCIFNDTLAYPAQSSDGKFHFEVRDSYGNLYEQVDGTPSENQYKYIPSLYSIEFSPKDYDRVFTCVYYTKNQNQEAYSYSPFFKNKVFMIEAFGEMQCASNGVKQMCYTCIKRATISGEISGITRQKSISNAITYNFYSAPVKRGESACIELFESAEHNYVSGSAAPLLSDLGVLYYENENVMTLTNNGVLVIAFDTMLDDSGTLKFS